MKEGAEALEITKGELNMELQQAKEAHSLMKFFQRKGMKMGLSMGFITVKDEISAGIRRLKEVKLLEGSLVTLPMNRLCVVTDVKALMSDTERKDFASELEMIQAMDLGWQLRHALSCALSELLEPDADVQEVLAQSAAVIQDFQAAYLDYVPRYMAATAEMRRAWGMMSRPEGERKALTGEPRKLATEIFKALLGSEPESTPTGAAPVEPVAAEKKAGEPDSLHSQVTESLKAWDLKLTALTN